VRVLAWLCVIAGILLVVAAFFITAQAPTFNPWPSLVVGFGLTTLGIVFRAIRKES
jgi:hypothetical protein